ncbi:putative extracellular nuclease [Arcanobacterium wilhelmae]|uniref:Extracellular nuclease n=1 Tax=Arcanobacterium wilhelmae TaxID=1803177 RepID=A0ABT9NB14_9ACTO|nr:ExeM/NucH family extracellular endonuclease [Arcanobacterium wilhelmae]MDP9800703.1 putative extracellular nuclease [Arcanobacterium wilhelmae]WFN90102.1 ExeM/NucH family extracellular endonuclease [Arcanobacterium wilhelmae]
MTMKLTRTAALGGGLAVLLTPMVVPMASATTAATNVVINEIYVEGTKNNGNPDYVELYNPTHEPVNLNGITLVQATAKSGKVSKEVPLKGTISPGGHFLVVSTQNSENLKNLRDGAKADQEGNFDFARSKTGTIAALVAEGADLSAPLDGDFAGKPGYIDVVGIGKTAKGYETAAVTEKTDDSTSFHRGENGADTDNNAQDFTVGELSPQGSGTVAPAPEPAEPAPGDPGTTTPGTDPVPDAPGESEENQPPASGDILPIQEIQGTDFLSPHLGKRVTTAGVITAVYPDGGFNGAYIQTEGSGGDKHSDASSAIFVYSSKIAQMKIGDFVKVTGTVTEYPGKKANQKTEPDPVTRLTEIAGKVDVEKIERTDVVAPVPVELAQIPTGDEKREALEGMLVKITGTHTITENYKTAQFGQIGLAPGDEPFYQPTEKYPEDDERAADLAAANKANLITLDDGISYETSVKKVYESSNTKDQAKAKRAEKAKKERGVRGGPNGDVLTFTVQKLKQNGEPGKPSVHHYEKPDFPASWLDVNKPVRVGAHVTFKEPMILDFRHQWSLQPRFPVQEKQGETFKDHSWDVIELTKYERPAVPEIPGDVTISSFNVLNYFTDLGAEENGCNFFPSITGEGLSTDYCTRRGAYSAEAFARQEEKIVEAITKLDSTVVGLEEIENSARFDKPRDTALAHLTEQLNKKAGTAKWDYVRSPEESKLGKKEDVIRLAYIYQKDKVTPVGDSLIFRENEWFENWARQPLAQRWSPVVNGEKVGTEFVSVVNHFKSKGSVASEKKGSKKPLIEGDNETLAGNNNLLRVRQAKEMTDWVAQTFPDDPVIILGDLNSYSKEAPVRAIQEAGYTSVAEHFKVKNMSYQFGGVIGSLDHALVNAKLLEHVTKADVWNVNALEPVAFEYARYQTTVNSPATTYDTTAYRSSDHDPIKVGLNLIPDDLEKPAPAETTPVETPSSPLIPLTPAETDEPSAPAPEETTPTKSGSVEGGSSVNDPNLDGKIVVGPWTDLVPATPIPAEPEETTPAPEETMPVETPSSPLIPLTPAETDEPSAPAPEETTPTKSGSVEGGSSVNDPNLDGKIVVGPWTDLVPATPIPAEPEETTPAPEPSAPATKSGSVEGGSSVNDPNLKGVVAVPWTDLVPATSIPAEPEETTPAPEETTPAETPSSPLIPLTPAETDEPSAPAPEETTPAPAETTPTETPSSPLVPLTPAETDEPSAPASTPWTELTLATNVGPVYANTEEIEAAVKAGTLALAQHYTVVRGGSVDVTLTGLTPNTEARVYLYSDPVLVTKAMADATGALTVTVPTTLETPLGLHHVVAVSTTPGEQARTAIALEVLSKEAPAPEATTPEPEKSEGAGNTGGQSNTGNGTPMNQGAPMHSAPSHTGSGLAFTGASVAGLAAVALATVGAGAAMVLRRRES